MRRKNRNRTTCIVNRFNKAHTRRATQQVNKHAREHAGRQCDRGARFAAGGSWADPLPWSDRRSEPKPRTEASR